MEFWKILIPAFIAGLPAILTAIAGLIIAIRRVQAVHTIVNNQRAVMEERIKSLEKTINDRLISDIENLK